MHLAPANVPYARFSYWNAYKKHALLRLRAKVRLCPDQAMPTRKCRWQTFILLLLRGPISWTSPCLNMRLRQPIGLTRSWYTLDNTTITACRTQVGDQAMPEEVNRLIIDAIADVLWKPSSDANENEPGSANTVGAAPRPGQKHQRQHDVCDARKRIADGCYFWIHLSNKIV